jgi:hypothetical protein
VDGQSVPALRPAMMNLCLRSLPAALAVVLIATCQFARAADDEFFETKIRPLLANRCFECHGEKKQQGKVRLDQRAAVFDEGPAGKIVVPSKPAESRLLQVIAYDPNDTQMPPKGKLPAEEIALLTEWVTRGAAWPESAKPQTETPEASSGKPREPHWAFQPIAHPVPPVVKNAERVESPIDRFVIAKLEEKGLMLSPQVDRRTLLRRVSFDLVGLPPTPEEVSAFEADTSPDAYAKAIDRLLASPLYGQRWGRHWLDVARYADTKGYVFTEDINYPYAYTYRDYVIDALNDDMPYDRFVQEQLAADKLGLPADSPELAALGFLTVGRRNLNNRMDIIDDRIDVTARGLMGLTVACARCHDHKFDPIPTADYYSLYGVFDSCDDPAAGELPMIGEPEKTAEYEKFQQELDRRQAEVAKYVAEQKGVIEADIRRKAANYLLVMLNGPSDERDVRRRGIEHWKTFLEKVAADDPLWGPWKRLSGLPKEGFADAAKAAIETMRQETPFRDGLGGFVLARLSSQPLGSADDLARAYGVLLTQSVDRPADLSPEDAAQFDALAKKLSESGPPFALTDDVVKDFFDRAQRNEERERQKKVDEFRSKSTAAPPRAMVLRDRPNPVEPVIFERGNPGRRGEQVPRRFLKVIAGEDRPTFAKDASGRLDLAKAITDPSNPLTARVIVNRVWQHHFGEAIVRTPSDFGMRADPPTHPELLDWLATEFMSHGWSLKWLHREMLLSATYQQASVDRSANDSRIMLIDPMNTLLWRMNPHRLEFEAMRDATLAVSGRLDPALGGRPINLFEQDSPRRTVYGYVNRNDLPGVWRSFDFPSPDASIAERPETTVPQQALFAMNSPFVINQAKLLAERSEVASVPTPVEKVTALYRLALQREPNSEERESAVAFVSQPKSEGAELDRVQELAQVLLLTNEFLFID